MPVRCLSDPWQYGQPAALYDRYYYPETDSPSIDNDYGGVHINCSLIGYVGYQLCLFPHALSYRAWAVVFTLFHSLCQI